MNEMQIFTYNETPVRTIEQDGELWWVLADVCRVLEIKNTSHIADRLDLDDLHQMKVIDSMGREQTAYIINEPGLYNVILRSDKPEAKEFKRWITHEVLPAIRQNGYYSTDNRRALTADDYLRAATIVGSCKNERLPYVFSLLRKAGIDLDIKQLPAKEAKPRDYSTMEILQDAQYNHGIPMAEISNRLGDVSRTLLCYYRSGKYFPNPERAERIKATAMQMIAERE